MAAGIVRETGLLVVAVSGAGLGGALLARFVLRLC